MFFFLYFANGRDLTSEDKEFQIFLRHISYFLGAEKIDIIIFICS